MQVSQAHCRHSLTFCLKPPHLVEICENKHTKLEKVEASSPLYTGEDQSHQHTWKIKLFKYQVAGPIFKKKTPQTKNNPQKTPPNQNKTNNPGSNLYDYFRFHLKTSLRNSSRLMVDRIYFGTRTATFFLLHQGKQGCQ